MEGRLINKMCNRTFECIFEARYTEILRENTAKTYLLAQRRMNNFRYEEKNFVNPKLSGESSPQNTTEH